MKKNVFSVIMVILAASVLYGCSKKSDDNGGGGGNSRKIKYEISGTFSGKLDVLYTDNVNGGTGLSNIAIPWTKEIEYGANVLAIGIGAQGSTAGVAGQTASIKIYSNGTVVKTTTATADASGGMLLPAITYGF